MIHTLRVQQAIRFMVKTHEIYQKQKRKGKDIPYLAHPLTVAMILARSGASEDLVIAGILHDTIEDSVPEKRVTKEMLAGRFGGAVADLVESVTELDKRIEWEARKHEALERIAAYSRDSILLKSADVIANNAELLEDHAVEGDATFERFSASKEQTIGHTSRVLDALMAVWPESPLAADLRTIAGMLEKIR